MGAVLCEDMWRVCVIGEVVSDRFVLFSRFPFAPEGGTSPAFLHLQMNYALHDPPFLVRCFFLSTLGSEQRIIDLTLSRIRASRELVNSAFDSPQLDVVIRGSPAPRKPRLSVVCDCPVVNHRRSVER